MQAIRPPRIADQGDENMNADREPTTNEHGKPWPEVLRFESQDLLGDAGWVKALKLEGYAVRSRRRPEALQQALSPYPAAL